MITRDQNRLDRIIKGNIQDVDGYDEAIKSNELYVLHHKLETPEVYGLNLKSLGLSNKMNSAQDLIDKNLYYHRPSEELIFLPELVHKKIHKGCTKGISHSYTSHAMWKNLKTGEIKSLSEWKKEGIRLRTDLVDEHNIYKDFQFIKSNTGRKVRCVETGEVKTRKEWIKDGYSNAARGRALINGSMIKKNGYHFEYI